MTPLEGRDDAGGGLTHFLLARIAEDEAVARALGEDSEVPVYDNPELDDPAQQPWIDFASRFDVARVLAECKAKRRIVTWQEALDYGGMQDELLGLLALPYADHPDYDQAWRP